MLKKLEAATNIAILAVAVLAGALLIRNLRAPSSPVPPQRPQIQVGSKAVLKGVDWHSSRGTLVMALQTTCHFCSESAPFYRKLAAELPKTGVHIAVVVPQTQTEGVAYLRSLQLDISDVRQGSLQDLNVSGTPTLIFVDQSGVVRHVWVGKLTPQHENEVIASAMSNGNN